jgi:hypothetical protein
MIAWLRSLFRKPAPPVVTIHDSARAMSRRAAECRREARSAYVKAHIAALEADIERLRGEK